MTAVTTALEHRTVRRLDWLLIPYLGLLYLFSFLDRVNIGNARLEGMEKDLGLTSNQFLWSISIFFVGYVLFEVPSNLMMKKASPSRWLSRIMVTWGICSSCMAAVTNYEGLLVCRLFLGICESGLFPGVVFYLSFWYRKNEVATRICLVASAASIAGSFSGVIAFGISQLDGALGLQSWQWIFLIEGLPTIVLGIITWFYLPDDPQTCRFLNAEEKQVIIARLKRDKINPLEHKFCMHQFKETLTDYKLYLYMMINIGFVTPFYCLSFFYPTIINSLGYTTLQSQLLSSFPYLFACSITIPLSIHSDFAKHRTSHIVLAAIISMSGFLGLAYFDTPLYRYLSGFLAAACFAALPIILGWLSNNMTGNTKKAVSTAMVVSFGNIGGVVAGQLYREEHKPRYLPGHLVNVGLLLLGVICTNILWLCLKRANSKLDIAARDKSRQSSELDSDSDDDEAHDATFRYAL